MAVSAFQRAPQATLFTGRNGAGACPVSGTYPVGLGATVLAVLNNGTGGNESANFEAKMSVAGQIQQTSTSNLSANEYYCIWYI